MRYEILRYEDLSKLANRVNKIYRDGGAILEGAKPMREKNKTVFYQTVMINDSSQVDLGSEEGHVFLS